MAKGYTYTEIKWLEKHAPTMSRQELTDKFNAEFDANKKRSAVASFVNRNGWVRADGFNGQFEKGHTPWHAGSVGEIKPNSGSFQAGVTPSNALPDGSERKRTMNGYTYMYRRVDGKFIPRSRCVWQENYGEIPEGGVIVHIDGDRMNDTIENLLLVTAGELMQAVKMGFMSLKGEPKVAAFKLVQLINKIREFE